VPTPVLFQFLHELLQVVPVEFAYSLAFCHVSEDTVLVFKKYRFKVLSGRVSSAALPPSGVFRTGSGKKAA
jgi:hypothetical protein